MISITKLSIIFLIASLPTKSANPLMQTCPSQRLKQAHYEKPVRSNPTGWSNSKAFTTICTIRHSLNPTPTHARSGSSKLHFARRVVRSGRSMLLISSVKSPHIKTLFKPNLGRSDSPPSRTYPRQLGTGTNLSLNLEFFANKVGYSVSQVDRQPVPNLASMQEVGFLVRLQTKKKIVCDLVCLARSVLGSARSVVGLLSVPFGFARCSARCLAPCMQNKNAFVTLCKKFF